MRKKRIRYSRLNSIREKKSIESLQQSKLSLDANDDRSLGAKYINLSRILLEIR